MHRAVKTVSSALKCSAIVGEKRSILVYSTAIIILAKARLPRPSAKRDSLRFRELQRRGSADTFLDDRVDAIRQRTYVSFHGEPFSASYRFLSY